VNKVYMFSLLQNFLVNLQAQTNLQKACFLKNRFDISFRVFFLDLVIQLNLEIAYEERREVFSRLVKILLRDDPRWTISLSYVCCKFRC